MSYDERTIDGFLGAVASEQVTPASGTATAVVGAVGTALCEMACIHTGRDGADAAAELAALRSDLASRRESLLVLADRDAAAVDALLDATDEVPRRTAAKRATGVPLAVAEACLPVLEAATEVTAAARDSVVPDAGTGAFLVYSALRAALFTVRTNLDGLADRSFVAELTERATELEAAATAEFARTEENPGREF